MLVHNHGQLIAHAIVAYSQSVMMTSEVNVVLPAVVFLAVRNV